jgi:predicted Zn-dependent protease
MRKFITAIVVSLLVIPMALGHGHGKRVHGLVLPDLPQHLEWAREQSDQGQYGDALAHLSLILLDKPIRYKVEFDDVDTNQLSDCQDAVKNAIGLWETAFSGEVTFEEVQPDDQADVTIRFARDVKDGRHAVAGHVDWTRQVENVDGTPTGEFTADISIRTRCGRSAMTVDQMSHCVAHEFGHCFGLDDSRNSEDLMGPLNMDKPLLSFSANELDFLRDLREQALQLRGEIQQRVAADQSQTMPELIGCS